MKKKMRMRALDGLKKAMDDDMKEGYQQVKVIADDKEGLEKGLSKAKDLVAKLPEVPMDEMESMVEKDEEMECDSEEKEDSQDDDTELFEMFKKFMKVHKEKM